MSEQGNLDRTMENKLIFPKAVVQKKSFHGKLNYIDKSLNDIFLSPQ